MCFPTCENKNGIFCLCRILAGLILWKTRNDGRTATDGLPYILFDWVWMSIDPFSLRHTKKSKLFWDHVLIPSRLRGIMTGHRRQAGQPVLPRDNNQSIVGKHHVQQLRCCTRIPQIRSTANRKHDRNKPNGETITLIASFIDFIHQFIHSFVRLPWELQKRSSRREPVHNPGRDKRWPSTARDTGRIGIWPRSFGVSGQDVSVWIVCGGRFVHFHQDSALLLLRRTWFGSLHEREKEEWVDLGWDEIGRGHRR